MNIIQNQTPIIDTQKIIVEVSSNINLEMMQLNKMSIVSYFLQYTNADKIELEINLVKSTVEVSANAKRPRERAKELYEKNEAVRYLIQKLELTLDA